MAPLFLHQTTTSSASTVLQTRSWSDRDADLQPSRFTLGCELFQREPEVSDQGAQKDKIVDRKQRRNLQASKPDPSTTQLVLHILSIKFWTESVTVGSRRGGQPSQGTSTSYCWCELRGPCRHYPGVSAMLQRHCLKTALQHPEPRSSRQISFTAHSGAPGVLNCLSNLLPWDKSLHPRELWFYFIEGMYFSRIEERQEISLPLAGYLRS